MGLEVSNSPNHISNIKRWQGEVIASLIEAAVTSQKREHALDLQRKLFEDAEKGMIFVVAQQMCISTQSAMKYLAFICQTIGYTAVSKQLSPYYVHEVDA